ncbi:MAG: hypothetical protein A2X45_25100 [Lentisphaerae bacterium GWF2_50_93]|nr:MAG: hypothetical protein A2X45_25100 [Lentisphaerae bacterium GWF2_50_93]
MIMNRKVKISEIARLSGVSAPVVSCILGNRKTSTRYSEKTYGRVMEIVERYGYRPNRTSRNLSRQKHGSITILYSDFYQIPLNIFNFILNQAENYGQILNLEHVRKGTVPNCIRENATDGIMIFEDLEESIISSLDNFRIPHVHINNSRRYLPNSITYDEEGLAASVLEKFVKSGRKNPLFVLGSPVFYWNDIRKKTFLEKFKSYGLNEPVFFDFTEYQDKASAFEHLIAGDKSIDAVFLGDDSMDYRKSLDLEMNRREMTVASIGSGFSTYVCHGCQCYEIDQQNLGAMAVDLLNRVISGSAPNGPLRITYNNK